MKSQNELPKWARDQLRAEEQMGDLETGASADDFVAVGAGVAILLFRLALLGAIIIGMIFAYRWAFGD
jgi:hypothetical protein